MKNNKVATYETPQAEVFELKTNCVLCQSPGGGSDPIVPGGDADSGLFMIL